jgi:hypothetical protein
MFTREDIKMTIDGLYEGSRRSHNIGMENTKEKGIKKMSQEELEREMTELIIHISCIGKLLQRNIEEN